MTSGSREAVVGVLIPAEQPESERQPESEEQRGSDRDPALRSAPVQHLRILSRRLKGLAVATVFSRGEYRQDRMPRRQPSLSRRTARGREGRLVGCGARLGAASGAIGLPASAEAAMTS